MEQVCGGWRRRRRTAAQARRLLALALIYSLARQTRDADQARRLLALASIFDGGSRPNATRIGSVKVQIVRDVAARFNARGPDGLVNGKAPGAQPWHKIERGPTPYSQRD